MDYYYQITKYYVLVNYSIPTASKLTHSWMLALTLLVIFCGWF